MRSKLVLAIAALLCVGATGANAIELVVNGGFETGDLTGWSGGAGDVIVNNIPSSSGYSGARNTLDAVHSGTYSLYFGHSGSTSDLSQVLSTVPGASYTISFWVNSIDLIPNALMLSWAGTTIIDLQNFGTPANGSLFSFTEIATTDATILSFALRQDPSYSALDDVSVTGPSVAVTPLPPAWTMMLIGIAGFGFVAYRRKANQRAVAYAIVGLALGFAGTAHANPMTLMCKGKLTMGGKTMEVGGETAILDMEKRTFKPPMYPEFPLIRVGETDLSFGSELPNLSTWGNLDRVSGTLNMSVMTPSERKALQAGGTVHFLAWLDAKCAPAQRMF